MRQYNILVTSIGGDVGQAICKALRCSDYPIKIHGTDCKSYAPFSLFCDSFTIVPEADGAIYKDSIIKLSKNLSIDLIYICSEKELFYISDHIKDFPLKFTKSLAIPHTDLINICRDKLKTIEFLKANGLSYPYSNVYNGSGSIDEMLKYTNYPIVIKKLSDCGSKNLHIVNSFKDFEKINCLDSSYLLQEYIPGVEYTIGIYKDIISNKVYVISLQRVLKNGVSSEVKVVFDKDIENLCIETAKKLNIDASINIQLRKQPGRKPVIFEINPRYSSTSFMRASFGFNDVIYAFENKVLRKEITLPRIRSGEAFRYLDEFYLFY